MSYTNTRISKSRYGHLFGHPAMFLNQLECGSCLSDQSNFIMERSEWLEIRSEIDAFYAATSDKEVNDHNQEIYDRHFGGSDSPPPKEKPTKEKLPKKNRPGYIYLIKGDNTDWYKIGQSKRPDIRINQLGTQGPFKSTLIHMHKVPDMDSIEQEWHKMFSGKREHGEWFTLSQEDVETFTGWKVKA